MKTTTTSPPETTSTPTEASTSMLAYIKTCTSLLDQLDASFPEAEVLTSKEKKHASKSRKGSERFAPQLVALAQQHGVNLKLVPLAAISNASAEATALVPLQKRIEAFNTRAAARMFSLQSSSWNGSAKLYTVLKRLSRDSGEIQAGLEPVEQYFNQRHPLVAKSHPKTKKGKAALAAEKAEAAQTSVAQAATVAQPTAPAAAPMGTPTTAPATATPASAATHS